MRFYFSHTTPKSIGGGPASWVASYLGCKSPSFGSDLEEIQLSLISTSKRRFFKSKSVEPKAIFRRKSKTMYIDWPCTRLTIDEIPEDYLDTTTQDKFKRAVEEIYDALDWAFTKRIKPTDQFDAEACLALIASGQHLDYPTEEAYRSELNLRDDTYRAYLRTQSFHKKIDTNWSDLHPNAANLLHHPDLWSKTDPRMPQGNQFGKYVLDHFDDLKDLPLTDVLVKLGLSTYESAPSSEQKIQALQTELGLVFAYVKKTGTVPAKMVRALLDRMEIEDRVKNSFWVYRAKGETSTHFFWMQFYLTDITGDEPRVFPDHEK